jgi:hypothetical protein
LFADPQAAEEQHHAKQAELGIDLIGTLDDALCLFRP